MAAAGLAPTTTRYRPNRHSCATSTRSTGDQVDDSTHAVANRRRRAAAGASRASTGNEPLGREANTDSGSVTVTTTGDGKAHDAADAADTAGHVDGDCSNTHSGKHRCTATSCTTGTPSVLLAPHN